VSISRLWRARAVSRLCAPGSGIGALTRIMSEAPDLFNEGAADGGAEGSVPPKPRTPADVHSYIWCVFR
jgi:hypothetical protein